MTPKTLIPRREFLGASGVLTGFIAAGSPLALLAPSRSWAVDLKALSSAEGTTLMAVARTIAPHDKLDDAAYALVVQSIDADAAKDPQTLGMLRDGIRQLGAAFTAAAEPVAGAGTEGGRVLGVLPDNAGQDPRYALRNADGLRLLRL